MTRASRSWNRKQAGHSVETGCGSHSAKNARRRPLRSTRSAGAALLAAMLTVSMVAIFASAALYLQYRAYEVERAERARVQASWLLHGAMDWARLVLREDAHSGGTDHLGEPWAIPLKEAKLSEFLAASHSDMAADAGTQIEDVF